MKKNLKLLVFSVLVALTFSAPQRIFGMETIDNTANDSPISKVPTEILVAVFDKIVKFNNSPQGNLREILHGSGFFLTKVCKSWQEILLSFYPKFLEHYHSAWTVPSPEGFYLNEVTQFAYNQCWHWNGTWFEFEKYYIASSVNSDSFPKLNPKHLSTLVVQSDFNPANLGSLSFLKSLLPQLQLKELKINIGDRECSFLMSLFDAPPSQISLENLVLEDITFSSKSDTSLLFTLMPDFPCQQLTWLGVKWKNSYIGSLIKSLKSCTNLERFEIQKGKNDILELVTEVVKNKDKFSHIKLIIDPEILIKSGRRYSSSYNSNLRISQQFFKMAIEGGAQQVGTFWLAELLFGSSEVEAREEAKKLYEKLISGSINDDLNNKITTLARTRLCELSDGEEETIKNTIIGYYQLFNQLMQEKEENKNKEAYGSYLLDFAWILREFPKLLKKDSSDFDKKVANIMGFLKENGCIEEASDDSLSKKIENLYLELYSSTRPDFVISGLKQLYSFLWEKNPAKLKSCLEDALNKFPKRFNNRVLLFMLGQFYEKKEKNLNSAEAFYREAAQDFNGEKGSSYAMASLANLLAKKEVNIEEYLRLCKESASLGNSYSAYFLYKAYHKGSVYNIPLPPEELEHQEKSANWWLIEAYTLGNPWAVPIMYKKITAQGKELCDQGNYVEAVQKYDEAINFLKNSISPSFSFYYDSIGYCYMQKYLFEKGSFTETQEGYFNESKNNFEKAIKINDSRESIGARINLGWLYFSHATKNKNLEELKEAKRISAEANRITKEDLKLNGMIQDQLTKINQSNLWKK